MKRTSVIFSLVSLVFTAPGIRHADAATTNAVVFLETMATNASGINPWTGSGCDNPWTVGYNGTNPFSQVTNSNYGGNPCV